MNMNTYFKSKERAKTRAIRRKRLASNRGYTLLFAVLTAVLVLGIAVFITSTSRKQFILSVTARESMYALYAADSGMECAAAAFSHIASTTGGIIYCKGSSVQLYSFTSSNLVTGLSQEQSSKEAVFSFNDTSGNGPCAVITFTTGFDSNNRLNTVIDSSGYNICTVSAGSLGPDPGSQTVERALELTYK